MYEPCRIVPNCEICSEFPHIVREIATERELVPFNSNGYQMIYANRHRYLLHQIIANQWIPNPNNYREVDHIDGDRENNRLSNLRWVTTKMNTNNKHSYGDREVVYIPTLPDDVIPVTIYGDWTFENLFFSPQTDLFYFSIPELKHYRELPYITIGTRLLTCATDVNNHQHNIYYTKFKNIYGL